MPPIIIITTRPTAHRPIIWLILTTLALLLACDSGSPPAPDFSSLEPGISYPATAALARGEGTHIHDRGVRQLEWHYDDGSLVEATIFDGKLSGLEYEDGNEPRDRSIAAVRIRIGVQSDVPEAVLRRQLGDNAITIDDTSDRECRWSYADGTLNAIFMRGRLERASWQGTNDDEPTILVEIDDPVIPLLDSLASHRPSDRYRALHAIERADDPRVADALLALLRIETDRRFRGRAALLLARAGDERAGELLLPDLEHDPIFDEIIDALGMIGDAQAEIVLGWTQDRLDDPAKQRKIKHARRSIDRRLGRDWPPRRRWRPPGAVLSVPG